MSQVPKWIPIWCARFFLDINGYPFILTPGQQQIFSTIYSSKIPRVVIKASTQYGKSEVASMALISIAVNRKEKILVIAPSAKQAGIIMGKVIEHIFNNDYFVRMVDYSALTIERLRQEKSKSRITFKNGSEIRMLTAEAKFVAQESKSLMGFGASVVLVDESSLIPDSMFSKILRMVGGVENGKLIQLGNPFENNHFGRAFDSPIYKKISIDYIQALNEKRISQEFLNEARESMSELDWTIFYECKFPSAGAEDALIPRSWIELAAGQEGCQGDHKQAGLDVARFGRDKTVYVFRKGGRVERVEITEKMDTMEVVGWVRAFLNRDKPDVLCTDVVGIGCHDDKTEILTNEGWKLFSQLNKKEGVLTMDPKTGKAFYVKPSRYYKYQYDGKMYKKEGQTVNFCVTPNHRFFFHGEHGNWWRMAKVEDIDIQGIRMKRDFKWEGKEVDSFTLPLFAKLMPYGGTQEYGEIKMDMDWWLEFLGWYFSEGCVQDRQYAVCISQKDVEKRDKIQKLLNSGYFNFHKKEYDFRANSKQLYLYLKQFGRSAPTKRIPDFIKSLSSRQIRLFLNTFLLGDGHNHKGMKIYYTSSKQMANDLQELVLKTGNYASLSCQKLKGTKVWIENHFAVRTSDMYTVNEWIVPSEIVMKTNSMKLVDYKGFIYCVEVDPYHLIYTRRKGKCFWNGNSGVFDRLVEVQGNGDIEWGDTLLVPINVGEAPEGYDGDTEAKNKFYNLRAQLHWHLRSLFKPDNNNRSQISIPNDPELKKQLEEIRYKYSSERKIKIEAKEEMKKRLGVSPDKADALGLAFWNTTLNEPEMVIAEM